MVWSAPQTIQNLQMGGHGVGRGLQVYRRRRWLCGYQRRRQFLQNLERARSWCSQCGCETEVHQMPRGPKCVRHAGGTWSGLVLMGGGGVDWLPLASHGSRGPERQRLREREREKKRVRDLASTWHPSLCIKPSFVPVLVQCWSWLVNDVSQRDWTSTWQLGKVLRGRMVSV